MPRPKKNRKICFNPKSYYFKPRGIPLFELNTILLEPDEVEAIRLADKLMLSHEKSAKKMQISRATFGRIVNTARKKIADAIIEGKAIEIKKIRRKNENSSSYR